MRDEKREELIIFLLRLWYLLHGSLSWPSVKRFVENKLNELLPEINQMSPVNENDAELTRLRESEAKLRQYLNEEMEARLKLSNQCDKLVEELEREKQR